mmetsp:Transcript_22635/g.59602  ORF Transcript_22635/g.59602 Transcript_22635/m.59602 type:complete len:395 (-) Transcript_22635:163-1347(-)
MHMAAGWSAWPRVQEGRSESAYGCSLHAKRTALCVRGAERSIALIRVMALSDSISQARCHGGSTVSAKRAVMLCPPSNIAYACTRHQEACGVVTLEELVAGVLIFARLVPGHGWVLRERRRTFRLIDERRNANAQHLVEGRCEEGFGDENDFKAEPQPSEDRHRLLNRQYEVGTNVGGSPPSEDDDRAAHRAVEEEGQEHRGKKCPAHARHPRDVGHGETPVKMRVQSLLLKAARLDCDAIEAEQRRVVTAAWVQIIEHTIVDRAGEIRGESAIGGVRNILHADLKRFAHKDGKEPEHGRQNRKPLPNPERVFLLLVALASGKAPRPDQPTPVGEAKREHAKGADLVPNRTRLRVALLPKWQDVQPDDELAQLHAGNVANPQSVPLAIATPPCR